MIVSLGGWTMRSIVGGALACALLLGCASIQHNTPSGRPEILITKASASQVKNALANMMINQGYAVISDTPLLVTVDKMVSGGDAAYFTSIYSNPYLRVTYSITESPPDVRIVANTFIISNAHTGIERIYPLDHAKVSQEVQAGLNKLRSDLESRR